MNKKKSHVQNFPYSNFRKSDILYIQKLQNCNFVYSTLQKGKSIELLNEYNQQGSKGKVQANFPSALRLILEI